MKVIYKYPITEFNFKLIVPYAAHMLSIGFDPQGQLCVWMLHNIYGDGEDKQGFEFLVLATGEETDEALVEMPTQDDYRAGVHPYTYNTTVMNDGLVWHVFSRIVFE